MKMRGSKKRKRVFTSLDRYMITDFQGRPLVEIGKLTGRPKTINDIRTERVINFSSSDDRVVLTIPKSSI